MEFGLFIQNYVPQSRRDVDPDAEHHAIFEDLEAVIAADKAGFKFVWITEHHFLDEYSHLSSNDVVAGYLAAKTERIHIGGGIFNPLPAVNHPAKVAERINYLDQLTHGRIEFGTGRGAGSHEILGFLDHLGITDTNRTKDIWEDVIREFPKMFTQDTYEGYQGEYWSLPPRKILPRPYGKAHAPMWYAAGNPPSYEMAGRLGLGVLGFSLDRWDKVEKLRKSYKDGIADAEPIGAFVNDNIMSCIAAYVDEDSQKAKQSYVDSKPNYLVSNVYRYHDTFPAPEWMPKWPQTLAEPTMETAELASQYGGIVLGDPDEALVQCKRWEESGIDQLVFGIGPAPIEATIKTIELLGKHVIPKIDTDPVVSTTRYREQAS
ncbi:MAG TPA: LLM class flavin-dependent oxidoreductase [Mycobacteriales bacterium]|jgi:alkanesulfonate monooxygenase SsuD/methylene tetrahydromethanopterin reductase-like flavin-dependent oxidoreductase (luciferase family)|nr:LLM class flavin-dependent oxidoreductase [Mycobacteriales bacterium]